MTRYRRFTSDVQDRRPIAPFLALLFLANAGWAQAHVVLDAKRHHLGIAGRSEWDEFAGDEPEGPALKLSFEGRSNPREATLLIRQHNVKLDWPVRLNGRPIGHLLPMEAALWHALPVPPGTLRDGANTLLIESPGQIDDVVIDQVALDARPVREALGRATLDVSVTDAGTGAPLPCRITITDPAGILAPLVVEPDSRLAARPGVVYTPHGRARIGLPPGKATVFGSRGFEYGVASRSLTLEEGQSHSLDLVIRREVSTPGLVACDTHVHTLTHSGHGDASIDERVVTLAGEGIELPVATDHDVFADLDPAARRQGVRSLINSGALQSDPMRLVRDWMAVLNHGERITAVGGSDSHDVARYIVGQARTYIACPDHDPARIDIVAAVRALHEGHALVSLGLLTTLKVDGRFHPGDLATGLQPILRVTATVVGPSWSRADRVELFADGVKLREQQVEVGAGARAGTKTEVTWEMTRPSRRRPRGSARPPDATCGGRSSPAC